MRNIGSSISNYTINGKSQNETAQLLPEHPEE